MKRLIPLLLICLSIFVVLIDGCALHPMQQPSLETEIPKSFNNVAIKALSADPSNQWWHSFNDAELEALMERAFAGNLDLAKFQSRLLQARAVTRQRRSERWPNLGINGSAGRSQQVSTGGEQVGSNFNYAVAAGYEVDLWRKIESRAMAQALETEATRQDLHALFLSISAQVAENYYVMVEQRARLNLIDQTIEARMDNLELVELRYREGMVTALDLYQARQNLANAKSQRPDVAAALSTTAHALSVLTGGYPTTDIGGRLDVLPEISKDFPLGLPSDLLQQRPDVQAAMTRLQAADRRIAAAAADRFPSINLLADLGYARSDNGTVISGTVWNLVGNLTAPLVDFGKRKAEVERTKAVYAERLSDYQKTVLTAFQEVEDALIADRQSREAIARIEVESRAAEDALRLSRAEYKDGLSTYLPVLTAQTTYFDSQTRLLSARRRLISARITLAKALGGNWMVKLAAKNNTIHNVEQ